MGRFLKHLKANLQLPCEVKGTEDFKWEEPYIFGPWSREEYAELKGTDRKSANFQLIEDYAVFFWNYR